MDKNMKRQLEKIFEAPEPTGKRKFFRQMEPEPISMGHILRIQFSYISKWSWGVAVFLLAVTAYLDYFEKQAAAGVVLSMIPLLVLAGIRENIRSAMYGMEELEMSTRFSLKSILLARMMIVGMEDVLLVLFLAWFAGGKYGAPSGWSFLQAMLYLFVPYLLAASGSLWIVRNFAGREELYLCTGFVLMISVMTFCSTINFRWIYEDRYLPVWLCAVLVLGGLTFYEGRKLLRTAESFA